MSVGKVKEMKEVTTYLLQCRPYQQRCPEGSSSPFTYKREQESTMKNKYVCTEETDQINQEKV